MEFTQNAGPGTKSGLELYAKNINAEVVIGKIEPVIGRESEIRRIIEIISRKTKNNPILIGEPGVGKTAIVEGLAQRIVNKDVPDNLLNKIIWELSVSALISGASYQGQFEQRLNDIIKEVKSSEGNIILFIDEFHQLIGAGKAGSGSGMDAANILKPMMARGEIKIIGATTMTEYRQYIEKDSALERRMSKIIVNEPSKKEALTILRGLKERWELFHGIKITDEALIAAVDLSARYISDRFLPDKAIDLVDEASAKLQTEMHSLPTELDQLKREIIDLQTEKASLKKETSEKSINKIKFLEEQITTLKKSETEMTKKWKLEREELQKVINIKEEIESSKLKIEKFQLDGNFAAASKLLYVSVPALEKELIRKEKKLKENNLLHDSINGDDIASVISKTTGIPLSKLLKNEKEKILGLTLELQEKIKGQNEAIEQISNAVLRSKAGINDPDKPIGSFLFLGPTGVGKTEVAKVLANVLFDSEKQIIRLDMSEYMEKYTVSKLIGAPPGYVGYDQPGALTETVRRKPYSIVLLDEIEKGHHDILDIFLQILDYGFIKDSQGRNINFRNTIIIMTSNIGSEYLLKGEQLKAEEALIKELRPEFINRIDDIIYFNPLKGEIINDIIKELLKKFNIRLLDNDYLIKFDISVIEQIKKESFDEAYGARPIRRYIQNKIETFLAQLIIENKIIKNKEFLISYDDHKREFILK